jgi:hypothetical protein
MDLGLRRAPPTRPYTQIEELSPRRNRRRVVSCWSLMALGGAGVVSAVEGLPESRVGIETRERPDMKTLILGLALFLTAAHSPKPCSTARTEMSGAVVARVDIPADAVDATLIRAGIEYHNLIGDFETSVVPGTTIQLHRPVGSGVHVLEIGWLGAASTPQQVTIPSVGQVYLNSDAIFVDFQSIDHTDFSASESTAFLCDGAYTNVLSVVATGTCWGARGSSGGAETRKCNKVSAGGGCTATITFTTTPPEPVSPTFECGGGGTIDFNTTTHVAHANNANDGTC